MLETPKNIIEQPNVSSNSKKVYKPQEIALILDIPIRSVYHLCDTTTEFKVKKVGRTVRINKESFDAWFNG